MNHHFFCILIIYESSLWYDYDIKLKEHIMADQQVERARIAQELLNKELEITDDFYVPRLEKNISLTVHLVIEEPEEFMDLLELEDYSEYTGEQFIEQVITCRVLIGVQNYDLYGLRANTVSI